MKVRSIFFIFLFNILCFLLNSNSFESLEVLGNNSKNLEKILELANKESLNKEQLENLASCLEDLLIEQNISLDKNQEEVSTTSEKTKKKRLLKKRYLFSALGLLGFFGINIGFFYKLFDRVKQNESELEKIKKSCSVIQQEQLECVKNIEQECVTKVEDMATELREKIIALEEKSGVDHNRTAEEFLQQLQELGQQVGNSEQVAKKLDKRIIGLERENSSKYNKLTKKVSKDLRDLEREVKGYCDERTKEVVNAFKQDFKGLDEKNQKVFSEGERARNEYKREMEQEARERHEEITKKFVEHVRIVGEEIKELAYNKCEDDDEERTFVGFLKTLGNLENFGIYNLTDLFNFTVKATEGVQKTTNFVENCANLVAAFSRLSDGGSSTRRNKIPTEVALEARYQRLLGNNTASRLDELLTI